MAEVGILSAQRILQFDPQVQAVGRAWEKSA